MSKQNAPAMLTHITPINFIISKLRQSIRGNHCILMAQGGTRKSSDGDARVIFGFEI